MRTRRLYLLVVVALALGARFRLVVSKRRPTRRRVRSFKPRRVRRRGGLASSTPRATPPVGTRLLASFAGALRGWHGNRQLSLLGRKSTHFGTVTRRTHSTHVNYLTRHRESTSC